MGVSQNIFTSNSRSTGVRNFSNSAPNFYGSEEDTVEVLPSPGICLLFLLKL